MTIKKEYKRKEIKKKKTKEKRSKFSLADFHQVGGPNTLLFLTMLIQFVSNSAEFI